MFEIYQGIDVIPCFFVEFCALFNNVKRKLFLICFISKKLGEK